MKVLVQNLVSLEYCCGEEGWTPNPDLALDFYEVTYALDFAIAHCCEDVRVVIRFQPSYDDVELPPLHLTAGIASHRRLN